MIYTISLRKGKGSKLESEVKGNYRREQNRAEGWKKEEEGENKRDWKRREVKGRELS